MKILLILLLLPFVFLSEMVKVNEKAHHRGKKTERPREKISVKAA